MSEVVEIEEKICLIQNEIAELQRTVRENEKDAKKWNEKLEAISSSLKVNQSNLKFIKNSADVVSLPEYKEILEKTKEMEEVVEECNKEILQLQKLRHKMKNSIMAKSLFIDKYKWKLANFGQIIPFPAKKE